MHSISSIKSFQKSQDIMNKAYKYIEQFVTSVWLPICVVLIMALQIHSVNAHSLVDNSIHGGEHNGQQHYLANNGNQSSRAMQQQHQQLQQGNYNTGNQNRCQSGWMWFNNKCWVTTQSRRDFTKATELCRKMHNSTLPTIHSEDENEFLRQNILSILHNSPIWLYAKHNHQYNKTRWLDKSEVNYTRWDAGQPSDKSSLVCIKTEETWYMKKAEPVDGQTECVSFWEDAKWGTQVGCLVLLPVVCERKLPPIRRNSDGQDATLSSQSEQQLMYPVSGASSLNNSNLCMMITYILALTFTVNLLLNQKGILSNTPKEHTYI